MDAKLKSQSQRRGQFPAVFFCLLLLPLFLRGQGDETAAPGPVIFCSYNLKNWLLMQRSFGEKEEPLLPKPDKEKVKVIEILTEIRPDILGVCEIGNPDDLKDLQSRLKKAGLHLPHLEHCEAADPTRSLGFLSRFPITARNSQTELHYDLGASSLPMQRGILDATVSISPGLELRFLGVHLKSMRDVAQGDQSLMRRNEAHLLRLHMDRILDSAPETKLVAYGDFNAQRNEPSVAEIIGSRASPAYMTDLYLRDAQGLVWTHFWDDADVYGRLDYFFVSRSLRPLVDMKGSYIHSAPDFATASDHRPIVMKINPLKKTRSRSSAKKD